MWAVVVIVGVLAGLVLIAATNPGGEASDMVLDLIVLLALFTGAALLALLLHPVVRAELNVTSPDDG